jgi:hypothetical protein
MNLSGSIQNGTADQVYSCPGSPQAIHLAAALATEGEVLWVRDDIAPEADVLIAAYPAR